MRDSHENLVGREWLSINTVGFDDRHVVLIKLEVLSSESSHIDNVEQVCLPRCHSEFNILSFVDQGRVWYWLGTTGVICRKEVIDQIRCFNVVYVGEGQDDFLIDVAVVVQLIGVSDSDRTTETI